MLVRQDLGNGGRFVTGHWDKKKKKQTYKYWNSAEDYYNSLKENNGYRQPATPVYEPEPEPEPQRDYYAEYLAALEQARQQRINSAKAAVDAQARSATERFKTQLGQIGDDYQSLRNQSEVERYKAQKSLREALANRGALDSGAGRQETLTLQNNYGNQINRINTEEQHEKNNIQSQINQILANADAKKAELEAATLDTVEGILGKIMESGALRSNYNYDRGSSKNYRTAQTGIKQGTQAFRNPQTDNTAQTGAIDKMSDDYNSAAVAKKFYDSVPKVNKLAQLGKKLNLGQIGLEEYSRLANMI